MPDPIDRRRFLKDSLLAGGAAAAGFPSFEEKNLASRLSGPSRAAAPAPPAPAGTLPKGRIKDLEISRIIAGGNLIGGWAHSRDLMYVSPLVKAYHTDDKILETFALAERQGVNTILSNPVSAGVINAYRKSGGRLLWISDCGGTATVKEVISASVGAGADAVYLQGEITDRLVRDGRMAALEDIMTFMKDQLVPCGLGAHCLETVQACVAAGLQPDFWMKTLHRDDYWSATPPKNRGAFDEVNGVKADHDRNHDNMWCRDAPATIEVMAGLKTPWIAFKVLAAGAIHPRDAFRWAFDSGADFLCVGMFDFQVAEDMEIAREALRAVTPASRPRPWMA